MHGHELRSAEVVKSLPGVGGTHVVRLHEPDRGEGADAQKSVVNFWEKLGSALKMRAVAGVAAKVNRRVSRFENESPPEPDVHIGEPATAPVAGGEVGDLEAKRFKIQLLVPVHLHDFLTLAPRFYDLRHAQPGDNRGPWVVAEQQTQAALVAVVTVVVGDEDEVEAAKVIRRNGQLGVPGRERRELAEDRVNDDVQPI